MTRAITGIFFVLLVGAFFWMYHVKHQTRVVDAEIARTMKLADAARERAGLLQAEYTLLNDPSRLAGLSGQYLPNLQPTAPGQFTTWADLGSRLPPIGAPTVAPKPLEPQAPNATLPKPLSPPAATTISEAPARMNGPTSAEKAPPAVAAAIPRPPPVAPRPAAVPRPVPPPARPQFVQGHVAAHPLAAPVSLTVPLPPAARRVEPVLARATVRQPVPYRPAPYRPESVAGPRRPEPWRAPVPIAPAPRQPMVASALGMARQMPPPPAASGTAEPWRPTASSGGGGQ